ncbi:MAG: anti-sigma factor [Ignavibacteriales bacterium]
MSEQKFGEMIYALSAGCLDKAEYLQMTEYISNGGHLPENELGELQNVVALLPAILEIEQPDIRVKDKVARRLYRMREEVRARRRSGEIPAAERSINRESDFSLKLQDLKKEQDRPEKDEIAPAVETAPVNEIKPEVRYPEAASTEARSPEIREEPYLQRPPVLQSQGDEQQERMKRFNIIGETYQPLMQKEEDEMPVYREKKGWIIASLISVLVIMLALSATGYYLLQKDITKGKEQISFLLGQVNALNNEITLINRNQRVLAILGSRDTRTINLDGTMDNPKGFGRLVITSEAKEGVIQFYNMPQLTANKVYQLWVTSNGSPISLGVFKPRKDVEYLPVGVFPEIEQNTIDSFMVTLEEGDGASSPTGKEYLFTSIHPQKK